MRAKILQTALLCAIFAVSAIQEVSAQKKTVSPVKIPAPRDVNYKNNYNKYVKDEAKFTHAYLINGDQVSQMTRISPTVRIYNAIDDKGNKIYVYVPVNSMLYDLWSDKLYMQTAKGLAIANGDQAGFDPGPITQVSTADAQKYIWNYINNKQADDFNSFLVNTQTLYMYINRSNSNHYVRYYHAMDDHGQRYLICYGVDKNWNDMTDVQYLLDRTWLCTKTCESYEMPAPRQGGVAKQ